MTSRVVLLLAANPDDTARLAVAAEFDAIRDAVAMAEHRDSLELAQSHDTSSAELIPELLHYKPVLVHFSGHGLEDGSLLLDDGTGTGTSRPMPAAALAEVFGQFTAEVRCVVLNACWSDEQALAIAGRIDAVVGMSGRITDGAARAFATTFHRSLAEGKSVSEAFELGRLQVRFASPDEEETPQLRLREGVGEIVVAGPLAWHPGGVANTNATAPASPEREQLLVALFHAHYGPLVRIASTLLDDTPGAEQIVRDAFVDFLYVDPCPDPGTEAEHLRRAVMAEAQSVLNRQRFAGGAAADAASERARVLAVLRGLPEPQSEVLVLRHLGSLDDASIAAALGLPEATVAAAADAGMQTLGPELA